MGRVQQAINPHVLADLALLGEFLELLSAGEHKGVSGPGMSALMRVVSVVQRERAPRHIPLTVFESSNASRTCSMVYSPRFLVMFRRPSQWS